MGIFLLLSQLPPVPDAVWHASVEGIYRTVWDTNEPISGVDLELTDMSGRFLLSPAVPHRHRRRLLLQESPVTMEEFAYSKTFLQEHTTRRGTHWRSVLFR
jgi:hypothetical protein